MKENEWFSFGVYFLTDGTYTSITAYNQDYEGSTYVTEDNSGELSATFEYGSNFTRTNKFTGFIFHTTFLVGDYFELLSQIDIHPHVDCALHEYLNDEGDCCQCHHSCSVYGCNGPESCSSCPSFTRNCTKGDCVCGAIEVNGQCSCQLMSICNECQDESFGIENCWRYNETWYECEECLEGYVPEGGICVPCDSVDRCVKPEPEECFCDDGYSYHNGKCSPCSFNCATCESSLQSYCTTCRQGYIKIPNTDVCVEKCPTGYLQVNS